MTVKTLIRKLSLYHPDALVLIDCRGPDQTSEVRQVVQEALNAVTLHTWGNRLRVTYEADGVTPRKRRC